MDMAIYMGLGMVIGNVVGVLLAGLFLGRGYDSHCEALVASLEDIAEHAREGGNIGIYNRFSSAADVIRQHMGIKA